MVWTLFKQLKMPLQGGFDGGIERAIFLISQLEGMPVNNSDFPGWRF
ncbi:hypothetical protein [Enterobacter sp. Cy-643]|nr:hypothetical protein [Enterobacter sp. Cy-643]